MLLCRLEEDRGVMGQTYTSGNMLPGEDCAALRDLARYATGDAVAEAERFFDNRPLTEPDKMIS